MKSFPPKHGAPRKQRTNFTAATAVTAATATVLLSGLVWAQAEVADPPAKDSGSVAANREVTLPTNTEDAKRQALELHKHARPEGKTSTEKQAAGAVHDSPAAEGHARPAGAGDERSTAQEKADAVDHRAAAMTEYRKAREALVEAQKHAKAGTNAEIKALTEAAREQLKTAREGLNAAREELNSSREAIERRFRQMTEDELKAFQQKLQQLRQQRLGSIASRKEAHQQKLKKELGAHVARSDIREELATHAWRVARLGRVIELASSANDAAALSRAENLLALEIEQHKKRLSEALSKSPDSTVANAKKAPPASSASDLKAKTVPAEALEP